MAYTFTPEADRTALQLVAALANVADEHDSTLLGVVVDDLLGTDGPPMGAVLLAMARHHLGVMRAHHGAESASVMLAAQIARTFVEDGGNGA